MNQRFREIATEFPSESSNKLVHKFLYREIMSLDLKPGTRLNLSQLSKELEVSRTTLRDAVLTLVDENLVEKTHDNKFIVNELKTKEVANLYASRRIIECGAAEILCETITEEGIKVLSSILDQMEQAVKTSDFSLFSKLDLAFHKNIVLQCNNEFLISMYQLIADYIQRYMNYTSFIDYPRDRTPFSPVIVRQHRLILHSLKQGIPANVTYLIRKHFSDAEKLILNPDYRLTFTKTKK
ncbi:MAG: GntR family transcriptional regulator [Eubacteriaceae bacterium]|nr:GntR family transcriptional regulator [Eubacteriaceae bacterium]